MPTFTQFLSAISPRRFRTATGEAITGLMGSVADVALDHVQWATGCWFPTVCPDDALVHIGRDRQIIRGPGETPEQYRARLIGAFDAWEWGGTERGILSQFEAYGLTVDIIANHQIDHEWPHDSYNFSRFWVVVPQDQHTWIDAVPSDAATTLRLIVNTWKSAHEVCPEVIVVVGTDYLCGWPIDAPPLAGDETIAGGTAHRL